MRMFMTCREAAVLLSDYQDGTLPLGPFLRVRVHLFNCPACRTLLATLRAVPGLAAAALAAPDDARERGAQALRRALERLDRPAGRRAWAATPVPREAERLLALDPDLPLRILAGAHAFLAREREPRLGPFFLPPETFDQLPPPDTWRWQDGRDGARRAEILDAPGQGPRLLLVYTPPGSALPPHEHLGSESVLVLEGEMGDRGLDCERGTWVHHPKGSRHAPRMAGDGCWYLVREEGSVRLLDPDDWRRSLRPAS